MQRDILVTVAAAAYGAIIGSFLNACIFRFPRRCLRMWRPKSSFCPQCRKQLRWYENIPLLSWLALRGRCYGCKRPIPVRYFLVELVTLILFVTIARLHLVVTPDREPAWGLALVHATLGSSLIVATVVDFEFRTIPNECHLPGLLAPLAVLLVPELFLGGTFRAPELGQDAALLADQLDSALMWWGLAPGTAATVASPFRAAAAWTLQHPREYPFVRSVLGCLIGAGLGAGLIALIGWIGSRAFRREAMGFGDVKYMGMIGAFTGWQGVLGTLFVATVTGTAVGVVAKIATGREAITGRDLDEASPLALLLLRLSGAPSAAPPTDAVRLFPGTALFARFATGDPYIAFGPFLSIGALAVMLAPDGLWNAVLVWNTLVAHHGVPILGSLLSFLCLVALGLLFTRRR